MGIRAQGNPLASFLDVWSRSGTDASGPNARPSSTTATGGVISDYTDPGPGKVYRAHIFTSSGTFDVTALSNTYPADIDYLVVAGGGGGGEFNTNRGGGGGAGGLRSNFPTIPAPFKTPSFPVSVQPYTITVGAGGVGAVQSGTGYINPGSNSSIGSAVVASGGGGGGNRTDDPAPGNYPDSPEMAGGSGGGAGSGGPLNLNGAPSVNSPDPLTPQAQGFAGGDGDGNPPNYGAGGGGGAGAVGSDGTTIQSGAGGNGLQVLIAGTPASIQPVGTPGTNPGGGYFAGGGGGGNYNDPTPTAGAPGGEGGGGQGGSRNAVDGAAGTVNTGGGGGGNKGRSGGSGIVVVRYQIAELSATARATGGAISYYSGKTIHAFTSTGVFNVTNGPVSAEFFMVASGGGAGYDASGGGGAGGVVHHPGLTVANGPYAVTIGAGGMGATSQPLQGNSGTNTVIAFPTTYTATAGGGGGSRNNANGLTGGSGGGGGRSSGSGGPAAQPAPNPGATEYGNAGGTAGGYGAGGGGAGNAGEPYPNASKAGWGGIGMQVPSTFQNPAARFGGKIPGGDPSGQDWAVAGGGGGGGAADPAGSYGGSYDSPGRIPGGPYYGGGTGALDSPSPTETNTTGTENTGGGGGGGNNSPAKSGGNGGSGIVLIAYTS